MRAVLATLLLCLAVCLIAAGFLHFVRTPADGVVTASLPPVEHQAPSLPAPVPVIPDLVELNPSDDAHDDEPEDLPENVGDVAPAPPVVLPQPRPKVARSRALLGEAQRWVGAEPQQLGVPRTLWCADAVNRWLESIGLTGTGSRRAASFAQWGQPMAVPQPGAIGVMPRYNRKGKRVGDHVVIVKAVKGRRVVAISPNGGGNRVRVHTYSVRRFYAFREAGA